MNRFIWSFILSFAISAIAWRVKTLTRGGAIVAFAVGLLVFGLGGFDWALVLITFFVTSSLLSRSFTKTKTNLVGKYSKGSRRDWGQVLANGGLAACLALLHYITGGALWTWVAYLGVMASVNADTWGTEIGVLSRKLPRRITDGRIVDKGTSGGVTLLGTFAALAGSIAIVLSGYLVGVLRLSAFELGVISLAGVFGSMVDSLLGATLQSIYYCPLCEKETERQPVHNCGTATHHLRGWIWLNNDWVNLISSVFGLIFALVGWLLLNT